MKNRSVPYLCLFLSLISFVHTLYAEETTKPGRKRIYPPEPGWSVFTRGGAVHQFKADMDDGGGFSADRFLIQAGIVYARDYRNSFSLAVGYNQDIYDFTGDRGFAGIDPWEDIHTLSLSLPIRWGVGRSGVLFFIPSIRSTAESGADHQDAVTGAGFAGYSRRFGDRLTIGPGIGIVTQIEDDAELFPVLIIDWKITERLNLTTGRGVGATLGPGLAVNFQADENWRFTLGGRYERLRFRLDENGAVPDGIGDDRSFLFYSGASYSFRPGAEVALTGGMELGGELRLEDENGNGIAKERYDPTGFMGLIFNLRF